MGRLARRSAVVSIVAALFVALFAVLASASEELSRDGYVQELEKVCKPGAKATQRAMEGVRKDVRASRIAIAARKFRRAASIFGRTIKTIGRVPRPSADRERLTTWFRYLKRQEKYLHEIAAKLGVRQTIKAQRLTARFIHNGNLANNVVLAFGFDYCRFKFSRFG
jgi:hypothetical protein